MFPHRLQLILYEAHKRAQGIQIASDGWNYVFPPGLIPVVTGPHTLLITPSLPENLASRRFISFAADFPVSTTVPDKSRYSTPRFINDEKTWKLKNEELFTKEKSSFCPKLLHIIISRNNFCF